MGVNRNSQMFSRIPKEKNEDKDRVIEHAVKKSSNFNLENILKTSGDDSATVTSIRNSASLYKGSHRRRRTAPLSVPEESSNEHRVRYSPRDSFNNNDNDEKSHHGPPRHNSNNSFSDVLAKKFGVPLVLFLILVFWGPMLLQLKSPEELRTTSRRTRTEFSTVTSNARKGPIVHTSEDESAAEEDQLMGPNEHDLLVEGNEDSSEGALEGKPLSNPVLSALRAVQNTDFKLPARQEEGDDKFNPQDLSEDEQNELKIQVQPRNKHQQQEEALQKGLMQQQTAQEEHPILSPLQQYQQRTQQAEKLQLQKMHQQQQGQEQQQQAQQWKPPSAISPQQIQKQMQDQQQLWQQQIAQQQQQAQQQALWRPPDQQKIQQPPQGQFGLRGGGTGWQNQLQQQQQPQFQANLNTNYKQADRPELIPVNFQQSMADIWDPILPTDTALFWHVPKNGGTTVADILSHCVDLVSASSIGASEGHGQESFLEVLTYHDNGRYVNVNPASIPGIKRAKQLGLAASGLADVVVLHRLHEGSELFDLKNRARVFCMFRNPIHRTVSMYYYLQQAKWEPTYDPTLADMTLLQYVNSNKVEENWLTRFLVHQYTGRLTEEHVEEAKQTMRNKIVVGILEDFQDSLKRFELYFNWWEINKAKGTAAHMVQCQQNHARTAQNKFTHPFPSESDPAFARLQQLNWADLELYEYAKQLFGEQGVFVQNKDASVL